MVRFYDLFGSFMSNYILHGRILLNYQVSLLLRRVKHVSFLCVGVSEAERSSDKEHRRRRDLVESRAEFGQGVSQKA